MAEKTEKKKVMAHGRITHSLPGRLRVRIHHPKPQREMMNCIQKKLLDQAGIISITPNTTTGSILIQYDSSIHSHENVKAILGDIGIILYEVLGDKSETAIKISDTIKDLDRRILQFTDGKINLRLIVPFTMSALGVRQIVKKGWGISEIPGYVLLWYALDAFIKFHQIPSKIEKPK